MSRFVVVIAGFALLASCSRGRQAEKLDRETALAMLREGGSAALPGPAWEMDLVVYEMGPAEAARLRFLKSLEPGLIKLTSTSDAEPPGFTAMPSWLEKRKPVKRDEFEPVDPKGASTPPHGDPATKPVEFRLGDPEFHEVTGIVQEGTQAVATVVVSYTPNQQQRTIAKAVASAGSQPGFLLPHLATDDELRKPSSRQVAFRRYDDGWRLEPRRFF
jgi:hypothetical protein